MNSREAWLFLNAALDDLFSQIPLHFEVYPLVVIQFGSSLSGHLKPASDIDLLFIFEHLPESRRERLELTSSFENVLSPVLKKLDAEGFHYDVSPLLRSRGSLSVFSGLYLDMVENSRIAYDPLGLGADLLARTKRFMERNQSKKIFIKGKPVWFYKTGMKPGERFDETQPF